VEVSWSDSINPMDLIVIVPADTKEGEYKGGNQAFRVRSKSSNTLRAPDATGLYEIRYLLDQGKKTLASQPIEVTDTEVTLTLSDSIIRAGDTLDVSWSEAVNNMDLIVIVPMGTAENKYSGGSQSFRVRNKTSNSLKTPEQTGLYEVRYLLDQGKVMMASETVEVVDADAPLDDGAGLKAPEQASPGETINVSWTRNAEGDERIALAEAEQPD